LYRNDVETHMPMHHIGVEVGSEADLDAALEGIELSGGKLIAAHDHAARRVVFVHDPDGLPIQLFVNREWTLDNIRSIDAKLAPYLI
jgi:catechol 2,3-dioxygenase